MLILPSLSGILISEQLFSTIPLIRFRWSWSGSTMVVTNSTASTVARNAAPIMSAFRLEIMTSTSSGHIRIADWYRSSRHLVQFADVSVASTVKVSCSMSMSGVSHPFTSIRSMKARRRSSCASTVIRIGSGGKTYT